MIEVMSGRNSDREELTFSQVVQEILQRKDKNAVQWTVEVELNVNGSKGTFKAIQYTLTKAHN